MNKEEKKAELTIRRDNFEKSSKFLLSELDVTLSFAEYIEQQDWFLDKESILKELESTSNYLIKQLAEENKEAEKILEEIKNL